jgi:hypothetical protein
MSRRHALDLIWIKAWPRQLYELSLFGEDGLRQKQAWRVTYAGDFFYYRSGTGSRHGYAEPGGQIDQQSGGVAARSG